MLLLRSLADASYAFLAPTLGEFGKDTLRQCGANAPNTCACQGLNQGYTGASFSFGCSWSLFVNSCKYAKRNGPVRKFKLKAEEKVSLFRTRECALFMSTQLSVHRRMARRIMYIF